MQTCIQNLIDQGAHIFGEILDADRTQALYREMVAARAFGAGLFMDEAEYLAQENHLNANPNKTFNFLNAFWDKEAGRPVLDDEIGDAVRLTKGGVVVSERLKG